LFHYILQCFVYVQITKAKTHQLYFGYITIENTDSLQLMIYYCFSRSLYLTPNKLYLEVDILLPKVEVLI